MDKNNIKFNKYKSEESYNDALQASDVDDATFSVVKTSGCNSNKYNNNSGDVKDLYISDTKLTDVYNSRKEDDENTLATSVTVGGIPSGTKLSDLTSMSLGEILDKMFFKTYTPQRNVSVSVSNQYHTIGTTTDALVNSTYREFVESDITYFLGNFKIEQDGVTTVFGHQSDGLDSWSVVSYTPSDRVVVNGTNQIKVIVTMKGGSAPKDSDGKECTDLQYNGGTFNMTITVNPYYNWYATSDSVDSSTSIKPLIQQDRVSGMGCKKVTGVTAIICGGNASSPQTIKIPGRITNAKIKINGQYQSYSFDSEWTLKPEKEVINEHDYNVYVFNESHFKDGSYGGCTLNFDVETI